MVLFAPAAAGGAPLAVLLEHYTSGSAYAQFQYRMVPEAEGAAGVVDCTGVTAQDLDGRLGDNLGGACFDVSGFPVGAELHAWVVDDNAHTLWSLFAGFDLDHDGCVRCTPMDELREGFDGLTVQRPAGADTLVVHVRTTSADLYPEQDTDPVVTTLTTQGELWLEVFAPGEGPCAEGGAWSACGDDVDAGVPFVLRCLALCVAP